MYRKGLAFAVVIASLFAAAANPAAAQLPLEPGKKSGSSVTAAYEGWFPNPDGTFSLLVGYYNRNQEQALDIPAGPDNRIEPGGPDQGQPTHFLPRRQWGVFVVKVPADFGEKKLTWTLVANGQTTQVPMGLAPLWEVSPLKDHAKGNTPPVVRFEPDGSNQQGPPMGSVASFEARVSEPATLTVWAKDDAVVDEYRRGREGPPVTVTWSKFRGPGDVTFSNPKPDVDTEGDGEATTTATFSEPGEYVLRLQSNDISGNGGGGAQCCWTNAHVRVTIRPGTTSP